MKHVYMLSLNRLLVLMFMAAVINISYADESLIIVTDPWPPYAYLEEGKATGIDVDIALSVLSQLGMEAIIEIMPWKRSLLHVKAKKADAILSASVTNSRKNFLHFPVEPISSGTTVFFIRSKDEVEIGGLRSLEDLNVVAMLGYKYCPELDSTNLLLSAARVTTLEQSFNMLINERVDLVVAVDAVGLYKAQEMGISDDVKILKSSRFCTVENHLAFAKKSGYDLKAKKFSDALIQFKKTLEYNKILKKYGASISH